MCDEIPAAPPERDAAPPFRHKVKKCIAEAGLMIKATMESRVSALKEHEIALRNEAALIRKGKRAIHGRARHGFQTGWVGQLVRISTKRPPDQIFEPMGVNPVIREWTRSDKRPVVLNNKGVAVVKAKPSDKPFQPKKYKTSGGQSAGVFLNPAAQNQGYRSCEAVLARALAFSECEVRHLGSVEWRPINFCYVHVADRVGGYGVAFSLKEGAARSLKQEDVIEAVDDYYGWRTWGDWSARHGDAALPAKADKDAYRFPKWGDVLDFLQLEQITRNGVRAEISLTGAKPTILTCFPVTVLPDDEGWAPGFSGEGEWTGRVKTKLDSGIQSVKLPTWANEK